MSAKSPSNKLMYGTKVLEVMRATTTDTLHADNLGDRFCSEAVIDALLSSSSITRSGALESNV